MNIAEARLAIMIVALGQLSTSPAATALNPYPNTCRQVQILRVPPCVV
jgi:hypothetical protein